METDAVEKVADLMAREQVRRMPVISSEKRLVGIVSLGDLSTKGADAPAGKALEGVSRGTH
jgi:CBS domain-containing protein